MATLLKCPHCGWTYDPEDAANKYRDFVYELVPTHDFPPPFRAVCPGTNQHPRNAETDLRLLWKDLEPEHPGRRCETCQSLMCHTRLAGWVCPRGCR